MSNIIALFDMSGNSVRDWAEAGETCFCLDIVNDGRVEKYSNGGSITFLKWDGFAEGAYGEVEALQPGILFGFPPCTDVAGSGAKHFEKKYHNNPHYIVEALGLVVVTPDIANKLEIPWYVENPVGVLSSIWRPPSKIFDPCDFGGYLPPDDIHPRWPEYIAARDGYRKKTCIWAGGEIIWPLRKSIPYVEEREGFNTQTSKLGGKSEKTKQIRSETPRGFARAVFEANYSEITGKPIPEEKGIRINMKQSAIEMDL